MKLREINLSMVEDLGSGWNKASQQSEFESSDVIIANI